MRGRLRVNRYSSRTEEQYLQWIKRSIVFHGKRHPAGMAAPEVEAVRLRVKEVEFSRHEILVRDGKGARARLTMLPGALVEPLQRHLVKVRELYEIDLREGVEAGAS